MNRWSNMLYALVGVLILALQACANQDAKPINPNGDSELALLMRDMHTEGMDVKAKLLNGEKPELNFRCERLMTAKATEPEKVASPNYAGYSKAFEESVEAFNREFNSDRAGSYQHMVDACMNCHREVCPGPMVKIKRMYLSEKEILSLTGK